MSLIKTIPSIFLALCVVALSFTPAGNAGATTPAAPVKKQDMPEYFTFSAPETDLPLRLKLTPFLKSQIVHLNAEVGSVTVDEMTEHVTAVVYDKTSVALFPKSPGAAHITVFGKNGLPIMARYAIVLAPAEKYVRVRQRCKKETDVSCKNTYVYYCPNLCYKTHLVGFTDQSRLTQK